MQMVMQVIWFICRNSVALFLLWLAMGGFVPIVWWRALGPPCKKLDYICSAGNSQLLLLLFGIHPHWRLRDSIVTKELHVSSFYKLLRSSNAYRRGWTGSDSDKVSYGLSRFSKSMNESSS